MPTADLTSHALEWVRWLWQTHRFHMFPVDHPSLATCAGAHHPERPCDGKRGKHPCGKWGRQATDNPALLRAAFAGEPRNIGIACKASGLLVVDEDRPGALADYAAGIGQELEETFTVTTAKGCHRYYQQPDGIELGNGTGALAGRGIDVRGAKGHGGYVVGPGSLHESGVLYEVLDPAAPILPAPAWLVTALQTTPAPPRDLTPGTATSRGGVQGGRPYKLLTALVQTVLDATEGVDRNSRLFWAAVRMYEHADRGLFPADSGRAALAEAARQIGLGQAETEATLTSARNTAARGCR
ncbi:bifunctional DNA primase/polymerase [Sphaerisporangium fuscum]|uniref:bifunctional DNA primase/polymerase n=1 Tax=Sphaerisporangium fuscum TaxID=2835868 RepID=UPI001BDC527D|nr:bifunctional DNA primase/polymerase [Sphaerisporangium fuscum]